MLKYMLVVFLAFSSIPKTLEYTPVQDTQKECYYCGLVDNCEMPYDTEEGKKISCEKSCLKFDGNAKDGKRVVVRTCGYFMANECVEGAHYEDPDTIGTICHCLDDNCNSADHVISVSFWTSIIISTSMIILMS